MITVELRDTQRRVHRRGENGLAQCGYTGACTPCAYSTPNGLTMHLDDPLCSFCKTGTRYREKIDPAPRLTSVERGKPTYEFTYLGND